MTPVEQFDALIDWALANGRRAIQKADADRKRLENLRARSAHQCGNCHWWMKSRECPLDNQRRGFPGIMNYPGCGKFQASADALAATAEIKAWATQAKPKGVE